MCEEIRKAAVAATEAHGLDAGLAADITNSFGRRLNAYTYLTGG